MVFTSSWFNELFAFFLIIAISFDFLAMFTNGRWNSMSRIYFRNFNPQLLKCLCLVYKWEEAGKCENIPWTHLDVLSVNSNRWHCVKTFGHHLGNDCFPVLASLKHYCVNVNRNMCYLNFCNCVRNNLNVYPLCPRAKWNSTTFNGVLTLSTIFLHRASNIETVPWNKMNLNSPSNVIRPNYFFYLLMCFHPISHSSPFFFPFQAQNLGSGPIW